MKQSRWDWLPAFMPGVVKLMADRRAKDGAAWAAECWKRGVVQGEPGWFYTAEGVLSVGTPISAAVVLTYHQARAVSPTAVLLDMRKPEGGGDVA